MKSAWDEVQPNHIYQVFKPRPLTEDGSTGLLYLYQPIIGAQALALYYAFLGDEEDQSVSDFVHIEMLNALNIGLPDFLKARKKLEGVGLLSVYVKEDPEFNKLFLYHLEEPLQPQAFFKDEMYSFLLWNAVGERKFNQMNERFRPKEVSLDGYQEITSSFSEVYGALDEQSFVLKKDKLEQIARHYSSENPANLPLDETKIDWGFLLQLAKQKYISEKNFSPSFKKQLLLYANMYGFDELQLVELMAEVVALNDGLINEAALARLIQQQAAKPLKNTPLKESEDANLRRFNTLRQTGFSENDLELIQMSEETPPMDFLEAIKLGKHSFVTDSETWLLKSLVEKSPLANSVINVLMHYVLVVQKNSALQANFVNKIATDWSEIGIQSPEAAIQHVRQLVKTAKETKQVKSQTNSSSRYRNPVRKETLPDWVENPPEETEDTEKQAKINQRLQEYLKRKEGEKE